MTLTSHFSLITIIINKKNSNYDNKSDRNTTVTTNTTTNTNNVRNLVDENMAKRTRHI